LDIKLLEVFCGLQYKDICNLPLGAYDSVKDRVYDVFEEKTPLTRRFNMKGSDGVEVEFGIIPNLDKITMGEYIDLNNYFEGVDTLHKAMAVLYRPIHASYKDREKYEVSSYQGTEFYSNIMKDMPLGIALGAKVFFYRLGMKLSRAIMNYSQLQMEEDKDLSVEEKKTLTKNIAGIRSYTHSLEETLLKLTKLL
jgi:chorismate synthase